VYCEGSGRCSQEREVTRDLLLLSIDRVYKRSGLLQTASVHLNFLPRHHIAGASAPGPNTVNDESTSGKCAVLLRREPAATGRSQGGSYESNTQF